MVDRLQKAFRDGLYREACEMITKEDKALSKLTNRLHGSKLIIDQAADLRDMAEKVVSERDAALKWIEAYREVAVKNYNAPESLTVESICSLVDAEAKCIVERKSCTPSFSILEKANESRRDCKSVL